MNELFEKVHCRFDSSTFPKKWPVQSKSNTKENFGGKKFTLQKKRTRSISYLKTSDVESSKNGCVTFGKCQKKCQADLT
jgi:hypothetical protein